MIEGMISRVNCSIGVIFLALLGPQGSWAADPVSGPPRSLKEAFEAAMKRSEVISEQMELLVQADELEKQAKATLMPAVSGSATFLHQPAATGSSSALYPALQNTVKVTGDQPLFRGFRDFAALRQRGAAIDAASIAVDNAARQLFYDTATAYFNELTYAQNVTNYYNEIEVNQKRLKELNDFYRIGRSRYTDLLTFKQNIAALEASLEAARTQYETAKDILAFETGWSRETPIFDDEAAPIGPLDVQTYLAKIDDRPDVKEAIANVQVNEEGIPIARGQHLPSVDLLGDYYFTRPGALSDSNWDVELALTIPIFSGGAIQSQVRQAESVAREYQLMLSAARRTAEEEVRSFYDAWTGDQRQLIKLIDSATLGKLTYEAQVKDYRNGLVTNLDVLLAITTFMDAERARDQERFTVKLDAVKLEAATAQRPELAETKKKQ